MIYYILVSLSFILSKIPIKIVSGLAWFLAILYFDVLRLRRKVILSNLSIAFNQLSLSQKRAMGRASCHHFMLTSLEFIRSLYIPLSDLTKVHGIEHIERIHKSGQPAFFAIAHIGNWEVMAPKLASLYPNVMAVVKKVGSNGMNRFVVEVRAKNEWMAIEKGKAFGQVSRKIIKGLKQNAFIGFPMDQRRNKDPMIPFFGEPSHTNHTLATLWLKYKTPILGAYSWRDKDYQHHVQFLPPLDMSKFEDCQDASEITLEFNRLVERMILKNPTQYLWQHDRWKQV